MDKRIGVYICECGPNIAGAVDIDKIIDAVSGMDDVVVTDKHKLLCSPDGKKFLPEEIRKHELTHLVVAACSPKQHELTFMTACKEGGINPYLFQMANIREQVVWITPDKEKATERSIRHLKAAINRVRCHTHLEEKEIECNPDVLIIGGGLAGISASLLLSSPGRKVYIVEKEKSTGGRLSGFEKIFPGMETGKNIIDKYLRHIDENDNIEILTETEVKEVLGFFGNFVVTVRHKNEEPGEREIKVGAIVAVPGMNILNPEIVSKFGYGRIKEVYTALEFEEMNLSGKIVLKNGRPPKTIGIIHCVGRKEKGYCSRVCCQVSMKFARYLMEKIPESKVTAFYQDISIPGSSAQSFYEDTKALGAEFICSDNIKLTESNGNVKITCDREDNGSEEKQVDMVVLLPAIEAAVDAAEISGILNIPLGAKGFFTEEHESINPVNTSIMGIYIAGCASGPKGIPETVSQSEAVAGKILSALVPGRKLETEARTSKISEELCTGCQTCLTVCCYSAITYNEIKGICEVNEVLCKGCGNCAAACPSGAAFHQHFTSGQIHQEMAEILI